MYELDIFFPIVFYVLSDFKILDFYVWNSLKVDMSPFTAVTNL
jgi:L-asparagine transporter-like permease